MPQEARSHGMVLPVIHHYATREWNLPQDFVPICTCFLSA
jgi:hypothetical protein